MAEQHALQNPAEAARPYLALYEALRAWTPPGGAVRAAEPAAVPGDAPELVRFWQRIPRRASRARSARAARMLCEGLGSGSTDGPARVSATLAGFCAEDGGPCRRVPLCGECPVRGRCDYPRRRLTIKDLPASARPRERLLAAGTEQLSDVELLAIIISGGSSRATALELAGRILQEFGTFRRLAACSAAELMRVHGIGPAKAAQIRAALAIARRYAGESLPAGRAIGSSEQLFRYMREKMFGLDREAFCVVLLDTKNQVIREETISVGSLNESVVHPREVFKPAIRESASAVIFVHNHPSGNPEPSIQDRRLTDRLCEAGRLVGIRVLDHMIIGRDTYFSFAERGLLSPVKQ
jgi:DNA repair protein RadC